MFKTKSGEVITWKEFGRRWKQGIEGVTPQQKVQAQLNGIRIQLLGLVLGLIVTIVGYRNLWWVGIILLGGLIVTTTQYIGLKQQSLLFKKIEEELKGGTDGYTGNSQ